jgi:hypothetical protein
MPVPFTRIKAYLDAIAANATFNVSGSPHDKFWDVTRDEFVAMNVPGVMCTTAGQAHPIPVVVVGNSAQSAILQILIADRAVCRKRQMPGGGGPFITDPGYSVTLSDGAVVTGATIQADIAAWIDGGCPQ